MLLAEMRENEIEDAGRKYSDTMIWFMCILCLDGTTMHSVLCSYCNRLQNSFGFGGQLAMISDNRMLWRCALTAA